MSRLKDSRHRSHREDRLDAIQRDRPLARDARETEFARGVIAEAERRRRNEAAIAEVQDEPYDIGASNQSISDYWQRVGGHPDAGEIDSEDVPQCAWCGEPLPVDHDTREEHWPYCSISCAVSSEND